MHDSDDTPNGSRPSPADRPPRESTAVPTVGRASASSDETHPSGPDFPGPAEGSFDPRPASGRDAATPWDDDTRTSKPIDPLVGRQLGEYIVKRRLGAGGMGLVYEAEQPMIGRRVAIKVLKPELTSNPEQMRTLLAEARASNAIRHRGIIDIFGFGQIPGVGQYIVMEYLEGEALDELVRRRAPMIPAEALPILDETLAALSAAHAEGVIHRDLKPSNIFMVSESTGTTYVKLLDFGLAKQAQIPHGMARQTRASVMVGTPEYMAPEQACGQTVGPMSDLYALGVIAFEMLTGRLPFLGDNPLQIAIQQVNNPAPRPSEFAPIPQDLDALIMDLLEKAPEKRPISAEVVRQRIKRIVTQLAQDRTQVGPGARRQLTGPRAVVTAAPPPPKPPPAQLLVNVPVVTDPLRAQPSSSASDATLRELRITPTDSLEFAPDTHRGRAVASGNGTLPYYLAGGALLFLAALAGGYALKTHGGAEDSIRPLQVPAGVEPKTDEPPEVVENPVVPPPVEQKLAVVEQAPVEAVVPPARLGTTEKGAKAEKKPPPVAAKKQPRKVETGAEVGTGRVHFIVAEFAYVTVDGVSKGKLSALGNEVELPAGDHVLELENGKGAERRTFRVELNVRPNEKHDVPVRWKSSPAQP